ncbi:MAG: hemolysin family protein [Acidobacteriota bacterium]|jgi:CBS domain containing-hemolysin-like protein
MEWISRRAWRPVTLCCIFFSANSSHAAETLNSQTSAVSYTNTDVLLLLTYVLLALVFSFLCSIAEAVLLSITPSYIAGLHEKNSKLAPLLRRLKQDNVDQSLAAILTLNTIAHTVGAIGSGAEATVVFGSAWFGLFSAVMTLMILFLSEIIPKTLGVVFWRKLAKPTAIFIRGLIFSLYPLIKISEWVTRLIARKKGLHVFSRDEFIAMASIGEKTGELERGESRILRNLFKLGSLKVANVMTPRTVISALQQDMTVLEAMNSISQTPFSRLPVYKKNLDNISGFVLKTDLLLYKAKNEDHVKIESLKRDILFVVENLSLSGLLDTLLDRRQHIAVVTGEYGETKGIVTLEDVVETLLGLEIIDEMDRVEDMQVLARQQWEKRARALGLDMNNATQKPPDENDITQS